MKRYNKILVFISPIMLFLPIISFAALIPCNGPDCDINSVFTLVNTALHWFIDISVSVVAITLAVAGGKMLLNPGNPGKRTEAIEMLKKTGYGILIVFFAWIVMYTVINSPLINKSIDAARFLKPH